MLILFSILAFYAWFQNYGNFCVYWACKLGTYVPAHHMRASFYLVPVLPHDRYYKLDVKEPLRGLTFNWRPFRPLDFVFRAPSLLKPFDLIIIIHIGFRSNG